MDRNSVPERSSIKNRFLAIWIGLRSCVLHYQAAVLCVIVRSQNFSCEQGTHVSVDFVQGRVQKRFLSAQWELLYLHNGHFSQLFAFQAHLKTTISITRTKHTSWLRSKKISKQMYKCALSSRAVCPCPDIMTWNHSFHVLPLLQVKFTPRRDVAFWNCEPWRFMWALLFAREKEHAIDCFQAAQVPVLSLLHQNCETI